MSDVPVSFEKAIALLREKTAIVVPTFISDTMDHAYAAGIIRDTVSGCVQQVADPARVCVSVDGNAPADALAEQLVAEYGVSWIRLDQNLGKLAAVRAGMRHLLAHDVVRYLVVIDQDGDHFPNEIANLVRACHHVESATGNDMILVLGQRRSRHHPMGFGRGELEEIADRVLLDALFFHASRAGDPLRLEYATQLDEFPDFHTGFKLFSREAALAVFAEPEAFAGVSEDCYFRHAVEAVMTVEPMIRGAHLVQVARTTINEQPITVFGALNRVELTADMIIWPCKRLEVPGHHVAQWIRNHASRLLLGTLVPEGRDEIEAIRRTVARAFDIEDAAVADPPPFF